MDSKHPEAVRLHKSLLSNNADRKTADKIAFGVRLSDNPSLEEREEWIKHITVNLETQFDAEKIKAIRMGCRCNLGIDDYKKNMKELYGQCNNLEEFAGKVDNYYTDNGKLYVRYDHCPCPFLKDSKMPLSATWCYCTLGYMKAWGEYVFEKEVETNLLKSIKAGDDICLVEISFP